ncbi:MAG TPA: cytochrome c, partial [Terriglobales bacterium]|nr:cytochrome c [Terriglobales bacterium]
TVPKIHNPVPRPSIRSAGVGASQGKQLYYRYGCNSCHGDNGAGVGDLRRAAQDYPTDPQLEAYIRHAPAFRPGTKMPAWNGIIDEKDYAPLIAYVRELGRASEASR